MTLPFEYRTPILSGIQVFGIQMVTVFATFYKFSKFLDYAKGPIHELRIEILDIFDYLRPLHTILIPNSSLSFLHYYIQQHLLSSP